MTYLTTADVAARLQKSSRTVRQLANHGELRASKVGRDWRYDEADVTAYVDRNANVPRAARRRRRAA